MSQILILQEMPGPMEVLRKCLGPYHQLHFADSIDQSMEVLHSKRIDMIISRVHLDQSNVFDFIKLVKQDINMSKIPFVCFCGKRNEAAKLLDGVLAKAATLIGADKYIILDEFCTDGDCDLARLRAEIESCL